MYVVNNKLIAVEDAITDLLLLEVCSLPPIGFCIEFLISSKYAVAEKLYIN